MADSAPSLPDNSVSFANPELDTKKLHSLPSEQQGLYLLNFTADLARFVSNLDADSASAYQVYIKKEVFKIVNLSSPTPSRVIRNNLGRSLAGIFAKGDRKLLFETINELVAIINAGKEKEITLRHAAVHCLGAVYEAAGDSAINLASLACSTLLKGIKQAQNNTGFRASLLEALGRLFVGINLSADEAMARDVWKQARAACSKDSALLVQARACLCLENLITHTSFFDNSNDFEKLQNAIWKTIDSQSPKVRRASANCYAAVLIKSYSETPSTEPLPRIKKMKKSIKKAGGMAEGDEEDTERPDSPVTSKPATLLSFSLLDLLRQIGDHYTKPATSNRARAGLAQCYVKTLRGLGAKIIEQNYPAIARHFFSYLLGYPSITHNRYRLLITRKFVRLILEDVVGKEILGESAQLSAAKFLVNDILKDYPQAIKERPEPNKHTLTAALSALASLMQSLGSIISSIAESIRDALLQGLQHPSYTVQIHTSYCLRAFVSACPQQLLATVTICMNSVNRELSLLGSLRGSPRRCVGYANGLSAVLSTSTYQPLYGSIDVYSRVLTQAMTLLKSSGSQDLRVSSTQIQVAYILIGGLMSLGPNFIKIHLSQLLFLWKNALPKPMNKENISSRNLLELSFLAHVRECALGSIFTFLQYNSRILTLDVTKRLAAMLQNTAMFLNNIPSKKTTEDSSQNLTRNLQLLDFDLMVRRRLLQCYTRLLIDGPEGSTEVLLQSGLLPLAISCFADPENYAPSLSASIASAAGTFESIWDLGDNYGFGVTALIHGFDMDALPGEVDRGSRQCWITKRGLEANIDQTLLQPTCGAPEHDSLALYKDGLHEPGEPPHPLATQVVDAAIQLFATSLPLQSSKVQESMLEQLSSFLSTSDLQRDPARKAAMSVNIATAIFSALKVAVKETCLAPGDLHGEGVARAMRELLRSFLLSPDQYLRNIAAQALGRLCRSAGNAFTVKEVDDLIEHIISNRDPVARSGCAVALGNIYAQLGGMTASFHLKKILSVLNSLSSDPHPAVHFWALESITRVADSADLNFGPHVTSTLGLAAQIYMEDTHNAEASALSSSNFEFELPTPAVVARCIDSIINVLGPDLQDSTKARDFIMVLIDQFQAEDEELVLVESLKCREHLSLYAPGYVDSSAYVKSLQRCLDSPLWRIRNMAIDALYNTMRRNAEEVMGIADPGLEDKLWLMLNAIPDQEVIKNMMRNWMHQTGLSDAATWVQRCNAVLSKLTVKEDAAAKNADLKIDNTHANLQDEEVAGFAASANRGDPATGGSTQEYLKWQTRTFAMDLLYDLISTITRDAATSEESPSQEALQSRIADVVRISFSASTANVVELRLRGLRIIDQILKLFGKTPDPDFTEASLLEQYQAQISSALTPAFAADSSPELAAQAINVCATFISTGIVKDVERMGRILKLLVSALENFSNESENAAIGDLKGLSSNALVMVKMSVFSAWAELQIASAEQPYLKEVMKPHMAKLTPLWLASLKEYSRLRFEPDISTTTSGTATISGNLDSIYAALNRETLLQFYQASWLQLVHAIASLIDEDSEFVFDALDGKVKETKEPEAAANTSVRLKSSEINYRDEPVAFFFVLFGLAFEALIARSKSGDLQNNTQQILEVLDVLKKILKPSVSGQAIYREVVFAELTDMLDRLVLTEPMSVQIVIVEIARNLCLGHPSARIGYTGEEENLSDDIDQMFELTRIIVLVLAGLVTNLTEDKSRVRYELSDEAIALLSQSLTALVDASSVYPTVIKTDLHACILHIFATILATPSCQKAVVPQALPILKRFLTSIASSPQPETQTQLRSALARFLAVLKKAQQREFETAVQCEKNALLACTILLSSVSWLFAAEDILLQRFAAELIDCLENRIPSKIAANCVRSLLLMQDKSDADEALGAMLLPHLINFITQPSDTEGLEESRSLITSALTSFVLTVERPKVPIAMALILPTFLIRASNEGSVVYKEIAAGILHWASVEQEVFRSTVAGFSAEQRQLLELVIMEGGPKRQVVLRKETGEPSIALKMNF
ncbi:hypothetical protein, variant [Verruconis gallopava]|uniref:LAA1-like C-terminal TPR repeats domain-containing protein n=1 Tax=Verruconis gallopava TaxID=253628 RepID=A0A0D1YCF0_9PEZI|nr:uncharacterized protein PV09_09798 [Verruconis gallopava]XP_016208232.1 hypothetical protein, variant [Verruconis gallopava]KIV98361.1 hypothetical protein PV09_09798 [Verruconis gallopava]KIV98362.1 hypothetical protein, variant [Verruconis gallopava]